jgi:hypothetical protein
LILVKTISLYDDQQQQQGKQRSKEGNDTERNGAGDEDEVDEARDHKEAMPMTTQAMTRIEMMMKHMETHETHETKTMMNETKTKATMMVTRPETVTTNTKTKAIDPLETRLTDMKTTVKMMK